MEKRAKMVGLFSSSVYLIVFCSVFLGINFNVTSIASSDSIFQYYSNGQKNSLPLSKERIAVRFDPAVTLEQQKAVVESEESLVSFSKREELSLFDMTIFTLRENMEDENVIQTINTLKGKTGIESVYPIFHFDTAELILTDEFIVKFAPFVSKAEIESLNALNNVEIVRKPEWTDRYTLRVKDSTSMNVLDVANKYYENTMTLFAMPNFIRRLKPLSIIPDDTYFTDQWALDNTGQDPPGGTEDADMDAPEGWEIDTGDSNIVIAIIDEGVDLSHEDLTNQLVGGYDVITDDTDPSPWANDAHGTACAGLAAAQTNNEKGVAGVCWNCKIMPIRMASGVFVTFWTTDVWMADAIEWAADNGADVLSNSWGWPYELGGSDAVHNAIIDAKDYGRGGKGCVIVFASGNGGGSVAFPARYPEVIAVGATDKDDVKWNYSSFGSELDVVAPSGNVNLQGDIWTTDITGSAGYNDGDETLGDINGNYTKKFGGTSAAAPQVAGLAALLLSKDPDLTSDEVQAIIESTADDKGASGWDQYYGWGRINIYNALSYKPPLMSISKVDNVGEEECVQPDDEITYTLTFAPDESDHTNVYVTDYLPLEVEFISADPDTGERNDDNRTYTWYIGDVDGGDPIADLELVVRVTSAAEPLGAITNKVEIESDTSYTQTTETTNVCCWDDDNDIIYVDSRATGFNTGTCWEDAYVRLGSALARAKKGCGDEIWVAGGWYYPTTDGDVDKSFEMVGGVGIYGGFKGDEVGRGDRNYGFYKTYLSGDIDPDGQDDSTNVVRADEITSLAVLVLDGFIITGAAVNGFDCNDASPVINHCLITQNGCCGLYSTGSGCPTLSHSVVRENGMGIDCGDSTPIIVNNWIHHNYGIGVRAGNETEIRNNTIVYNGSYGVSKCGDDDPQLVNCILWYNNSENGYYQLQNCDAVYSCVTDPTNLEGNCNNPPDLNNNIYCNPLFAYSDPTLYNFHLDPNSPCIDMGYDDVVDPQGETDIDGDDRIFGDHVDMGADEVNCDDVFDEWDLNADGTINLHEFSGMADAWLKEDEDPNWTNIYQKYDLVQDGQIDLDDLNALVCYEDDQKWLWQACWFSSDTLMMMGMDGGMDKAMAAAAMTDEQIEQAKLDKWYKTRPPHVMTVWEEIKLVEESLDWLEKVWLEDEQLRKEVRPEEWKEFINSLYDWLAQMKEQSAK